MVSSVMCTVSGAPCGCSVAVLGLGDLSLVLLDFRSCRLHHRHVDDVIATITLSALCPLMSMPTFSATYEDGFEGSFWNGREKL